MEADAKSVIVETAGPMTAGERIQALDVVRGFALLGIFLMNIEFFNRATSEIGHGMPSGLTGVDWFAGWFVAYFVQGKFWTIFSLLFGMGFAVMLTRKDMRDQGPQMNKNWWVGALLAVVTFGGLFSLLQANACTPSLCPLSGNPSLPVTGSQV